MELTYWELFARLVLATVLGGAIGLERGTLNRPAGLRTHILVCVGSTLAMLVSMYGLLDMRGGVLTPSYDGGRIAAQVISGIGFFGAGTILREGSSVRGLTTAASLWTVAGIGLAVGSGMYVGGGGHHAAGHAGVEIPGPGGAPVAGRAAGRHRHAHHGQTGNDRGGVQRPGET